MSYTVRYMIQGSMNSQTISISSDSTQATISGLQPATDYSIQVRAESAAGTGPYSTPINVTTNTGIFHPVISIHSLSFNRIL